MKQQANVTAYIGLDHGGEEHTADEAINTTVKALGFYGIDGATFCKAVGFWQGQPENSLRLELLHVNEAMARKALKAVCKALAQWSIVYTVDGQGMQEVTDNAAKGREARKAA